MADDTAVAPVDEVSPRPPWDGGWPQVATVLQLQLTRHELEEIVGDTVPEQKFGMLPLLLQDRFEGLLVNRLARIAVTVTDSDGEKVKKYRVCRVSGIVSRGVEHVYSVGPHRTLKYLELEHGGGRRPVRMTHVLDSLIRDEEVAQSALGVGQAALAAKWEVVRAYREWRRRVVDDPAGARVERRLPWPGPAPPSDAAEGAAAASPTKKSPQKQKQDEKKGDAGAGAATPADTSALPVVLPITFHPGAWKEELEEQQRKKEETRHQELIRTVKRAQGVSKEVDGGQWSRRWEMFCDTTCGANQRDPAKKSLQFLEQALVQLTPLPSSDQPPGGRPAAANAGGAPPPPPPPPGPPPPGPPPPPPPSYFTAPSAPKAGAPYGGYSPF